MDVVPRAWRRVLVVGKLPNRLVECVLPQSSEIFVARTLVVVLVRCRPSLLLLFVTCCVPESRPENLVVATRRPVVVVAVRSLCCCCFAVAVN